MSVAVKCQYCATSFKSAIRKGVIAKYCSRDCANLDRRGYILGSQVCLCCGKSFKLRFRETKFCSTSCYSQWQIARKDEVAERDWGESRYVQCKWCDKPFRKLVRNRLFCSRACYRAHQARPKAEKRCTKCGTVYPATSDYFNRGGYKGGLRSECKKCHSLAGRAYHGSRISFNMTEMWDMHDDQQGLCAYCEIPLFGVFEVDHMLPVSRGGSHEWQNMAVVCPFCNRSKKDKTAEEYMERLRAKEIS